MTNPTRLARLEPESEQLSFRPRLEASGAILSLKVDTDDDSIIPWGLWGAVVAIAFGFGMLVLQGLDSFRSIGMITLSAAFVGLGAIAARFGPRTSLRTQELMKIDPNARLLIMGQNAIRFEDVTEIVYAMVKYPVSQKEDALRVQAFTVLARVGDNVLVPIIEASPDKNDVFLVARTLGSLTGHEVSFVGIGVQ